MVHGLKLLNHPLINHLEKAGERKIEFSGTPLMKNTGSICQGLELSNWLFTANMSL